MPIFVCGINHKTAPVELREQVIFSLEKLPLYINDLITNEGHREAVLLSTCNRSELYCETDNIDSAMDWFCRQHSLSPDNIAPYLYIYNDAAAIEHIMNVACGLDSMILGEPQILGQMKTAFSESCAAGGVNTLFNRLFQQVFSIAKEVRSSTAIGACPVSVSSTTVNFVKQKTHLPLDQANVLLIGAGNTIELVLRYLQPQPLKKLLIANRSMDKAIALAQQYHGATLEFKKIATALPDIDILISATGGATPIITQAMLENRKKPILIVDIAVPRDIEATATLLENIFLYTIDDLKTIIQDNLHGREHAAEKAREIIKTKCQEFMAWLNALDEIATTITAYRKKIETLTYTELSKALRQLQRGEDPKRVISYFAQILTNKLLHAPTVQLRQAGVEGRMEILQLMQQLLAIPLPQSELL